MKWPSLRRRAPTSLIAEDAAALMAAYGDGAYDQARTRAREERLDKTIDGSRPRGHWDAVRREIARIAGRQTGLDTATRYLEP